MAAIKKGVKPLPCNGKDECDEYCSNPENIESCIIFAEAAGFISPEEATMARKTGGKGPGNCRGKEECEKYCEDPAHGEECFNFAVEQGFIEPEEAEEMREMMEERKEMMEQGEGFEGGGEGSSAAVPIAKEALKWYFSK